MKMNFLIEEYLGFNDTVLDIVAELMQYEIEVDVEDDKVVFPSVICDNFVFTGNRITGKYRITDYDTINKAAVLKESF